jgi:plasmid segregation protein ParM
MILCVDLGNLNIKTSEEIKFSSRFRKGEFAPVGEQTIEYDGVYYTMQKGDLESEFNKAEKNYMPNLLYAIGKSTDDSIIDLVLGVPLDNLGIKERFKEALVGKTFKFKMNGTDKSVKINRLATVGEGLSSYYTLEKSD